MNKMNRFTRTFRIFVALLICSPLAAQEFAEPIVKKVRENYEKLQSMQADFVQNYTWSLAGETQTLEGKIFLKKDDRYRVETKTQTIVTDGATVWTYSPEKQQVIIDHLSKTADDPLPRELIVKYTRDFKAKLLGTDKSGKNDLYRIQFTPRDEDSFVREVTAWIDKDTYLAQKIEQHDINDNVTVYELKNIQRDAALADQLFTFKIPDGAEVVDLR
jgi:chaperone LolA